MVFLHSTHKQKVTGPTLNAVGPRTAMCGAECVQHRPKDLALTGIVQTRKGFNLQRTVSFQLHGISNLYPACGPVALVLRKQLTPELFVSDGLVCSLIHQRVYHHILWDSNPQNSWLQKDLGYIEVQQKAWKAFRLQVDERPSLQILFCDEAFQRLSNLVFDKT